MEYKSTAFFKAIKCVHLAYQKRIVPEDSPQKTKWNYLFTPKIQAPDKAFMMVDINRKLSRGKNTVDHHFRRTKIADNLPLQEKTNRYYFLYKSKRTSNTSIPFHYKIGQRPDRYLSTPFVDLSLRLLTRGEIDLHYETDAENGSIRPVVISLIYY